jgi:hypothetical protein
LKARLDAVSQVLAEINEDRQLIEDYFKYTPRRDGSAKKMKMSTDNTVGTQTPAGTSGNTGNYRVIPPKLNLGLDL